MKYINPEKEQEEEQMAQFLAERLLCEQRKLGDDEFSMIDRIFSRDGVDVMLVELKTRKYKFGHFKTQIIDALKIDNGLNAAKFYELPFCLIERFSDGAYYICRVDEDILGEERMGGRKDRNDPNDQKPCYYIPNEYFRRLI